MVLFRHAAVPLAYYDVWKTTLCLSLVTFSRRTLRFPKARIIVPYEGTTSESFIHSYHYVGAL